MTTSTHHRDILAAIAEDPRRVIDQAAAEGRVLRGEASDWRADALERAGELAVSGRLVESRRVAETARN